MPDQVDLHGPTRVEPAENFEQAYGMICEGLCPNCGGGLIRRPPWGYAFCIVHDMGWQAIHGDHRWVGQRIGQDCFHWAPEGVGWSHFDGGGSVFVLPGPSQPWLRPR